MREISLRSNDMEWARGVYERMAFTVLESGGTIVVESDPRPREEWRRDRWMSVRIEARVPSRFDSGGSVVVTLAGGIAVDIDASSGGGGSVSSDFEVDGRVRRTSIEGAINGGGPQLHLRTSGGSIRIRRR